jgi:hypothetical protein
MTLSSTRFDYFYLLCFSVPSFSDPAVCGNLGKIIPASADFSTDISKSKTASDSKRLEEIGQFAEFSEWQDSDEYIPPDPKNSTVVEKLVAGKIDSDRSEGDDEGKLVAGRIGSVHSESDDVMIEYETPGIHMTLRKRGRCPGKSPSLFKILEWRQY